MTVVSVRDYVYVGDKEDTDDLGEVVAWGGTSRAFSSTFKPDVNPVS